MTQPTPLFQRASETHPLGKCTAVLEVAVPQQLRDDLVAFGALSAPRKTASEMARQILTDHLYGRLVAVTNSIDR